MTNDISPGCWGLLDPGKRVSNWKIIKEKTIQTSSTWLDQFYQTKFIKSGRAAQKVQVGDEAGGSAPACCCWHQKLGFSWWNWTPRATTTFPHVIHKKQGVFAGIVTVGAGPEPEFLIQLLGLCAKTWTGSPRRSTTAGSGETWALTKSFRLQPVNKIFICVALLFSQISSGLGTLLDNLTDGHTAVFTYHRRSCLGRGTAELQHESFPTHPHTHRIPR